MSLPTSTAAAEVENQTSTGQGNHRFVIWTLGLIGRLTGHEDAGYETKVSPN